MLLQVFVHSLQKVDMRAEVGQTSSTSLAVAGGTAGDRQVVCYSSNPTEVQPAPAVLKLPAGGLSALQLVFKPCKAGKEWVSGVACVGRDVLIICRFAGN